LEYGRWKETFEILSLGTNLAILPRPKDEAGQRIGHGHMGLRRIFSMAVWSGVLGAI